MLTTSLGILVYDADCGFCKRSASAIAHPGIVETKPWQSIRDLSALGLPTETSCSAAYWIPPQGQVRRAEAAISAALVARGGLSRILGAVIGVKPLQPLAASIYRLIARHRHSLPGGTNACRLP